MKILHIPFNIYFYFPGKPLGVLPNLFTTTKITTPCYMKKVVKHTSMAF